MTQKRTGPSSEDWRMATLGATLACLAAVGWLLALPTEAVFSGQVGAICGAIFLDRFPKDKYQNKQRYWGWFAVTVTGVCIVNLTMLEVFSS